jgi:hypothetical protein
MGFTSLLAAALVDGGATDPAQAVTKSLLKRLLG